MNFNTKDIINKLEEHILLAGKKVLEIYYSNNLGIELKEDNSPITLADKIANEIIIKALKELTPNTTIISEETTNIPSNELKELFWLIDPLDGTKEFINKNDEFTINIALIKNNKPIAGLVYCPVLKELYKAFENKAYCNNRPIFIKEYDCNNVKIATSKNHSNPEHINNFLKTKNIKASQIVKLGSSLKMCKVASGEVDIYPRLGPTMEWDTAAAHAVLKSAGGYLYTLDGKELMYGKKDYKNPYFIASNILI